MRTEQENPVTKEATFKLSKKSKKKENLDINNNGISEAPRGATQLESAMKMKFHEVSSSTPPDLQCVPRKGPRGHTWRL
jgi:hypothetical protein